jgi:hypothetical protein
MTYKMRTALELIDKTDTAQTTVDMTWADRYTAFVNWRTAEALERRGLVAVDSDGDVTITDAGREATA